VGRFRCRGSRVFVFELVRIHFDAHAFLLVGNLFEGSNVVSGTLLEPFVAGNHDSSGQEVTLQSNGVLVVFPLRESRLVYAKQPGKLRLAQIHMLSQKTKLLTAKPVRFLKDGHSCDVHQLVHLEQDGVHVAAFSTLNDGGSASFAYHIKDWLSAVGDIGAYHSGNILGTGVDGTLTTYVFGPRISYHSDRRITPFAQVLFGGAHGGESIAGGTSGSENAFAMTIGGGVDYRINHRLSLRPLQVDYLMTRFQEGTTSNQTQNNLRVSTGIVVHF
jgi:outer membrane immunogenic protein